MNKARWIALMTLCQTLFFTNELPSTEGGDTVALEEISANAQYIKYFSERARGIGRNIADWWNRRIRLDLTEAAPYYSLVEYKPCFTSEAKAHIRKAHAKVKSKQGSLGQLSEGSKKYKKKSHARRFKRPSHISKEVWALMKPYFLPTNHPVRSKLDELFSERVTASSDALTAAGFYGRDGNRAGRFSHATVAHHDKVKGYVLKFFTDDSEYDEIAQLKKRVDGARSLKASIQRHGWEDWFKVPRKWIYPLPKEPKPVEVTGCPKKGFVLIAENMSLMPKKTNYKFWREQMSQDRLDALYMLLQEEGLLDSVYPFNIPFSIDGKIAFIDLEHNHLWPVPFFKLQRYLHPTLQPYWETITDLHAME